MFRVMQETTLSDLAMDKPWLVLAGMFMLFVLFLMLIRERRRQHMAQEEAAERAARRQWKLARRMPKITGALVFIAVLSGCTQHKLSVFPPVRLWFFEPIEVTFRTDLLPESLHCATVVWDFGDGNREEHSSDICEPRRTTRHVYLSSGIRDVTAKLIPSVGKPVTYHGVSRLMGEAERSTSIEVMPMSGGW